MEIRNNIPNFITCLNLISGSIALVYAFDGQLHIASLLVFAAAIFDFLDGFIARILKAGSPLGKELDSLADLVSFGLVPSAILYKLMSASAPVWGSVTDSLNILPFMAFLVTVFSAVRLAKFNVDIRQSDRFMGLPTPANAIFIVSIPVILAYGDNSSKGYILVAYLVNNYYFLLVLTLLFSGLLVSNLPLLALKFKNFKFKNNISRYIIIVTGIVSFLFFGVFSLPLIIISYLIVSMFALAVENYQKT